MSSGKTLAQIAHAAVMAADLGYDVSHARVIAPEAFDLEGCVAEVRDAGLTRFRRGRSRFACWCATVNQLGRARAGAARSN